MFLSMWTTMTLSLKVKFSFDTAVHLTEEFSKRPAIRLFNAFTFYGPQCGI